MRSALGGHAPRSDCANIPLLPPTTHHRFPSSIHIISRHVCECARVRSTVIARQQRQPARAPLNPLPRACSRVANPMCTYVIYECTAYTYPNQPYRTGSRAQVGGALARKCVQKVNITHARAKPYFEKINSLFAECTGRNASDFSIQSIHTREHTAIPTHTHSACTHSALSRISRISRALPEKRANVVGDVAQSSSPRRCFVRAPCCHFCRHRHAHPNQTHAERAQSVSRRSADSRTDLPTHPCMAHTLRHGRNFRVSRAQRFESVRPHSDAK